LYVLTDSSTPFVQDGYRDGEGIRQWMHDRFRTALTQKARPFLEIGGPHERRLAGARDAIRSIMAQPFNYARANALVESTLE
jgi:nicotinamide riboside kinase